MRVLFVDPGLRNCAVCVLFGNSEHWKIEVWDHIDFGSNCSVTNMMKFFHSYMDTLGIGKIDRVRIELQGMMCSSISKTFSYALVGYFTHRDTDVKFQPAHCKFKLESVFPYVAQLLDQKVGQDYKTRKRSSVLVARTIIENTKHYNPFFQENLKYDDVADSFLGALYEIILEK